MFELLTMTSEKQVLKSCQGCWTWSIGISRTVHCSLYASTTIREPSIQASQIADISTRTIRQRSRHLQSDRVGPALESVTNCRCYDTYFLQRDAGYPTKERMTKKMYGGSLLQRGGGQVECLEIASYRRRDAPRQIFTSLESNIIQGKDNLLVNPGVPMRVISRTTVRT